MFLTVATLTNAYTFTLYPPIYEEVELGTVARACNVSGAHTHGQCHLEGSGSGQSSVA